MLVCLRIKKKGGGGRGGGGGLSYKERTSHCGNNTSAVIDPLLIKDGMDKYINNQ